VGRTTAARSSLRILVGHEYHVTVSRISDHLLDRVRIVDGNGTGRYIDRI
jgi:hypothetical protein